MPKFSVDGVEYNTEDLTDNGKSLVASLQFVSVQLEKFNREIAIYQIARNACIQAIKSEIRQNDIKPVSNSS